MFPVCMGSLLRSGGMKKRKRQRMKTAVRIILTILVLVVILYLLQRLLMPKYMDDVM